MDQIQLVYLTPEEFAEFRRRRHSLSLASIWEQIKDIRPDADGLVPVMFLYSDVEAIGEHVAGVAESPLAGLLARIRNNPDTPEGESQR